MTRRRFSWLNLGLGIWAVIVYVFLFLPIGFMVAYSFNENRNLFAWSRFSTKWYGEMFDNQQLKDSVKTSLGAASVATIVAVLLGTFAGIALARRPGAWTKLFLAIVLLILVTPEIVDATGLRLWFTQITDWSWVPSFVPSLDRGLAPLWVGQSIFSSAVVTMIVRARMAGVDETLEQAAADLYAPPRQAFMQITLPLVAPAVLAGGLLAFTFALDNVVVSQFVSGPDSTPFSVYVFGLKRTVMRPEVAAMATILLGATLVALALVAFVLRRSGDDSTKIAATFTGAA